MEICWTLHSLWRQIYIFHLPLSSSQKIDQISPSLSSLALELKSAEFKERRKCIKGNFVLIKGYRIVPACIDACCLHRSVLEECPGSWTVSAVHWLERARPVETFVSDQKCLTEGAAEGKGGLWWGIGDCFYILGSASWGNVWNRVYFFYFNHYLIHWGILKCIADFLCLLPFLLLSDICLFKNYFP